MKCAAAVRATCSSPSRNIRSSLAFCFRSAFLRRTSAVPRTKATTVATVVAAAPSGSHHLAVDLGLNHSQSIRNVQMVPIPTANPYKTPPSKPRVLVCCRILITPLLPIAAKSYSNRPRSVSMTNQNNATQAQGDRYHILKTDPETFQADLSGAKTFEIRLNDRGDAVGDVLGLRETKHIGAEMRAGAPLVSARPIFRRTGASPRAAYSNSASSMCPMTDLYVKGVPRHSSRSICFPCFSRVFISFSRASSIDSYVVAGRFEPILFNSART